MGTGSTVFETNVIFTHQTIIPCQVALGKIQKAYSNSQDLTSKEGFDSLWAVPDSLPDPAKSVTLPTGAMICSVGSGSVLLVVLSDDVKILSVFLCRFDDSSGRTCELRVSSWRVRHERQRVHHSESGPVRAALPHPVPGRARLTRSFVRVEETSVAL